MLQGLGLGVGVGEVGDEPPVVFEPVVVDEHAGHVPLAYVSWHFSPPFDLSILQGASGTVSPCSP